jgi:hypothetical protein
MEVSEMKMFPVGEYQTESGKRAKVHEVNGAGIFSLLGAVEVRKGVWVQESWTPGGKVSVSTNYGHDLEAKPERIFVSEAGDICPANDRPVGVPGKVYERVLD